MAEAASTGNVTSNDVQNKQTVFERDLFAYFNEMKEDQIKLLNQRVREGWTPERVLTELESLIPQ